ncbi:MAG: VanZ family protein [Clostridiales bacterium]|jgi:VanZ family protein|nr:VanZ family protein [Clostridiales bacterium]
MRKYAAFLPAAIYYSLIFFLSSKDYDVPIDIHPVDKAVHFIEFAILAFLLSLGFFRASALSIRMKIIFSFLVTIGLGALDEFHQYFVPGREVELFDLLADALGAAAGVFVFLIFYQKRKRTASGPAKGIF